METQNSSWVEGGMVEEVLAKEVTFDNEISVMSKGPVNKSKTYPEILQRAETFEYCFSKIGCNLSSGHIGERLES